MVKFPLLVSLTLGVSTLLTRIRARVVAGLFTFQLSAPLLAVLLASAFQVAPPSREISIRTLLLTPVGDQRIVWVLLMDQISPPLGLKTVRGQIASAPLQSWSMPSPQISGLGVSGVALHWVAVPLAVHTLVPVC